MTIQFWNDFSAKATFWAAEMNRGNTQLVFDEINDLLESHESDFCFDLTVKNSRGGVALIFSPEGDHVIADAIDEFLEHVPRIEHWSFLGRRLKKDLHDVHAIIRNMYLIDSSQLAYRVTKAGDHEIVEMIVPEDSDLSEEEAQGMVDTFLWHAIGEETVMKRGIEGTVLFDDHPSAPTISAADVVVAFGHAA